MKKNDTFLGKIKSIRSKILLFLIPIIVLCIGALVTYCMRELNNSVIFSLDQSMVETAETASVAVQKQIDGYKNLAIQFANDAVLSQRTIENEDEREYSLDEISKYEEYLERVHGLNIVYITKKGHIPEYSVNVGNKYFFLVARESSEPYITEPMQMKYDTEVAMNCGAPIIRNNEFLGIMQISISIDEFSKIFKAINIGGTGSAGILNKNGRTIAEADPNLVKNQYNSLQQVKEDPQLVGMAAILKDLVAGNKGFAEYSYDGQDDFIAYTPIDNTDGWGLYVSTNQHVFTNQVTKTLMICIIISIVAVIFIVLIIVFVAILISKPAKDATRILPEIVAGDFTVDLTTDGSDEIAQMMSDFDKAISTTRNSLIAIKNETESLGIIGEKLSNDASETASAVHQIASNIESVKGQVFNEVAGVEEMNATITQIAMSIQGLDTEIKKQVECISESTAATEEMIANIRSVSHVLSENEQEVKNLTLAADEGRDSVEQTLSIAQNLESQSNGLLEASDIIQAIASQTSLLAMNAAIEAAHAGDAGKGFAVVADEIRKLADNSTKESKKISAVLQDAKTNISELTQSANFVNDKFTLIFDKVTAVQNKESQVSNMMQEQSSANEQVLQSMRGIAEITQIVQDESGKILTGSQEIQVEIQKLNEVTASIDVSMNEMTNGAAEIRSASENVNTVSIQTKEIIEAVKQQLNKFRT